MARVRVVADDGWIALDERLTRPDFDSEVFRRHLAERLAWAVADAEEHAPAGASDTVADGSRGLAVAA